MEHSVCINYALEFGLIKQAEDINAFRYGPHKGVNAVKKLYEHKNNQHFPRILPHQKQPVCQEFILQLENNAFNGESLEDLIMLQAKTLGEQKLLSDQVSVLSSKKRCLDTTQRFTLPRYTRCSVVTSVGELVDISTKLPGTHPLTREDIERVLHKHEPGKNADEVISGLVEYNLI